MTKEEFLKLQQKQLESGLNLTSYLKQNSVSYSNYRYWRSKYADERKENLSAELLAPISVRNAPSLSPSTREGISVSLPNGMLVHFSPSMEDMAMRFLSEMGGRHV